MAKSIREAARAQDLESLSLSQLIHQEVRVAIETAVHEELRAALGTTPYERSECRRGYRNGIKTRTLTGPTGPLPLTLPRATLFTGAKEWTSRIVPRYHRRMPEVNEAIVATYLAGGNTRRIRGALQPLLKAAPLSKSAVSRVIATLKDALEAWRKRSLADVDVIYLYLDAFALRVRSGGKVASVTRLGRGRRLGRRPQAAPRPRSVRGRVVRGVEGLSRGSRHAWLTGPSAYHHRWKCRAATRGGRDMASGGRAALLCPQAAQSRAQGAHTCPRGHPR